MSQDSTTELKEDLYVQAILDISGKKIEGVPCKLYLPKSTMDKPFFWFRPSKAQYDILSRFQKSSFTAHVDGFNGKNDVIIFAPKVYFSKMSTTHWGPNLSESMFKGEPQNLKVVQCINLLETKESSKAYLNIWISPNCILDPDIISEFSYRGDIKYERVNQVKFKITNRLNVIFDKHFKTIRQENGDIKQFSYLVGCAEVDSMLIEDTNYEDEILSSLDNFLLIVSLGSRTRTSCLGWEVSTNNQIIKFYRGDFSFPSGKSEFLINCAFPDDFKSRNHTESLIDNSHFEEYLNICYSGLISHPNPKVIRDAIVSVVPGRRRTIEESFLSMFSALESLVLDFRKRYDMEFVIDDKKEWIDRRNEIENSINEIFKNYSGKQRHYIYRKLDELNRIPLRIAFEKFCNEYKIDISDLWPLYKNGSFVGLSDIRNKLIHGDRISDEFNKMLSEAENSLQYMLERILLTIMGFSANNSDVSKLSLSHDQYRLNWTVEEQIQFKEYIDNM